jgi:hypothetical protein
LRGYTLRATDGEIGKVDDFYFDEVHWTVRYLVADTGGWLTGRKVLISPAALKEPDWRSKSFPVSLNRKQVENSPDIASDQPVSRRHEAELTRYYGWPMYWGSAYMGDAYPGLNAAAIAASQHMQRESRQEETHLRSMHEIHKYALRSNDEHAGHIDDFIADDNEWIIRYLVVDTRDWLPGKKVLLAPDWVTEIRWEEAAALTGISKEDIQNSPPYDPSEPVNRAYEERLYDFYGRPAYWRKHERGN